jgi:LPS-assembly lipoprotein
VKRALLPALLTAALAVALSACGFHLRGTADVPESLQPVFVVSGNPNSPLHRAVEREIRIRGLQLAERAGEAQLRMHITREEFESRPVTLDQRAHIAEIALVDRVEITVRNRDDSLFYGPQPLMVRRIVINDPDNPVATAEPLIREEMTRELARRLVDQMSLWSRQGEKR